MLIAGPKSHGVGTHEYVRSVGLLKALLDHAPNVRDVLDTTNIGERRTVNLDDGSTVTINAKSSIRVSYDEHQRVIDLLEGQALFKVAADSARPFIVTAGTSTIRAPGTQFDVYRKVSDTVVTVVEGRSRGPLRLHCLLGEQVDAPAVLIHLRTSERAMTLRYPKSNQVRATAHSFLRDLVSFPI